MAAGPLATDLQRYGPAGRASPGPTPAQARAYCRRLARGHYENFTVASLLLPRELRPHFYAIYAWCRWADDLADEMGGGRDSLQLLDWWRAATLECFAGRARHPVLVALQATIGEYQLTPQPLLDLLDAFCQDQTKTRYATVDEVLDYCRRSANPVGRLILMLGRCQGPETVALADDICTGLQLANFCQDVVRDYDRGRIYLPAENWRRFGVEERDFAEREPTEGLRRLLEHEVKHAERFLRGGWPLVGHLPRTLRIDVDLFVRGGLAILNKIRRRDYDVWTSRPTVGKLHKVGLLMTALVRPRRTVPR